MDRTLIGYSLMVWGSMLAVMAFTMSDTYQSDLSFFDNILFTYNKVSSVSWDYCVLPPLHQLHVMAEEAREAMFLPMLEPDVATGVGACVEPMKYAGLLTWPLGMAGLLVLVGVVMVLLGS